MNTSVILGSDANSRRSIWENSGTNNRGKSLFDYNISVNFFICNRRNSPTFVTASREKGFYLTLTSNAIAPLISDRRIIDDHSFSDIGLTDDWAL